jgi:putative transposase
MIATAWQHIDRKNIGVLLLRPGRGAINIEKYYNFINPKLITMPDVYTQTSMQLLFAVKHRNALIHDNFRDKLHKYIGGILKNQKHKPLAINSVPDHIHIFFCMYPYDIPALVRDLISGSSTFIKDEKLSKHKFQWQNGYGLFSYTMSHRPNVIQYIQNQESHHKKKTFREEYLHILQKLEIQYNEKYLFDFFD